MGSFSHVFSYFSRDKPRTSTFVNSAPSIPWLLKHRKELQRNRLQRKATYLYEYLVVGNTIGLRDEIERFFNHHTWPVFAVPGPRDPDPQRYAILAVLPYYLALAFNRLIARGLPRDSPGIIDDGIKEELRARETVLEEEPIWAMKVARLEETLVIPAVTGEEPHKDLSAQFLEKNIVAESPHVLFV